MKKNAYAESTITATAKRLRSLQRNTDLTDPEKVKAYIAEKDCSNSFKETLIETYDFAMKSLNKEWDKPFYERYDKLPRIPTQERINMLIAKAKPRMSLILSMMRDLGTRPIELTWLKLQDIDLEKGNVNITGAKHTVGRAGKLRPNTLEMLRTYVTKIKLNLPDRLFPTTSENISEQYRNLRNSLAKKLDDPTFKTIRLYDFRHFKASTEYHKTKDLLHIKALLGHKDLRTTLRYVQLLETLETDDYHCKAATTIEQATQLIENGFEYVTEIDGTKLFRKPK
jgi:integrase